MSMRSWIRDLFTRPVTRTIRKAPRQTRLRLEALEERAVPATYTVVNTADSGVGSLREAITQANASVGVADSIVFNHGTLPGTNFHDSAPDTITLTSGQFTLTDTATTTISGPGANLLSISGNGKSRVFLVVKDAATAMCGLTITGGSGDTGGGLCSRGGTVALTDCIIRGNGTEFGGGISTGGEGSILTMTDCTVSGNSTTGRGGGLFNDGTATLTNCTLSGNSSRYDTGGGVFNGGGGTATLTGCTVSGNRASQGGGVFNRGTATLTNCTVSGNSAAAGGGVYTQTNITIGNTIVAANTATGSTTDVSGNVTSLGHNLIGSTDDSIGWVGSDLTGTSAAPINPLLAPLGDYGGPTRTMALLPGSPALDAADPGDTSADQRGVAVQNGRRDIGAFESRGFTVAVASGDNQSAPVNAAFASPLVVLVTANDSLEPVAGGVVTFTAPGNGASTALSSSTATVGASGQASVTAAANGTPGSYTVTAAANGVTGAAVFHLTNTAAGPVVLVGGVLQIIGTDQSDVIFVTRRGSVIRIDVRLGGSANDNTNEDCHEHDNSFSHFTFNAVAVTAITIEARGGNDVVLVGCNVTVSASIDGGAGNDLLVAAGSASDSVSDPGGNNIVLASGGNDTISTGNGGDLILTGSGRNVVNAGGGNDIIKTGGGNDLIFAGPGNDLVDSGAGNDIVVGGEGDDLLIGGSGRDLLIGGMGADRLVGNGEEDILIAGTTAYDANAVALQALMAEWSSAGSYATRVANLTAGSGNLTGTGYRFNGDDGANQTVFNDSSVDVLTGDQGSDWFLANKSNDNGGPLDLVTDKTANELWSDTDF